MCDSASAAALRHLPGPRCPNFLLDFIGVETRIAYFNFGNHDVVAIYSCIAFCRACQWLTRHPHQDVAASQPSISVSLSFLDWRVAGAVAPS